MRHPHLTAGLPGTGGRLRATDDDFVVEEVPAYEAAGVGDHLYLRIEKRGISTHEAVERVSRALGVRPRDIGYAGLKDAHAVSIQTFSVEHLPEARARDALIGVVGVRLLSARPHRNKLRLGHLCGNRFRVRVRDVVPDALLRAESVLTVLRAKGSPNWFGEQRFGAREDNDSVGRLIVRGELAAACDAIVGPGAVADRDERVVEARALYAAGDLEGAARAFPPTHRAERAILDVLVRGGPPERALFAAPRPILRLLVSAYQSSLFNRLLTQRLPDVGTLEAGDLAFLHAKGAVFRVDDPAAEQPRADAFEISPSGPLPGTRTILADGRPGERERTLLAAEGVEPAQFDIRGLGTFDGERRPYRVPLRDVELEELPAEAGESGPSLLVSFELPRGAYATAVLREVMKNDAPPAA